MAAPKMGWSFVCMVFVLAAAGSIPAVAANVAEFDDYWIQRRDEALQWTQNYTNNLALPTRSSISDAEIEMMKEGEDLGGALTSNMTLTRRELRARKNRGPCRAFNVIDRCWRCDPLWARKRKSLANCAMGFGRNAKGGAAGRYYVVTDPSDDYQNPRPGTLRHAVIQKRPLWITFARSMNIRLQQELIMQSHKTIDGRGVSVHISGGGGITIQFVRNIIITNIRIHDIVPTSGGMIRDSVDHIGMRVRSEGDGISIFGASDIWLDHLSMWKASDGLIDAVQASTGITISNCHFTDHDKVLLFGASDQTDVDKDMKVTVAFNHFGKRLVQRMPRCRTGFFHLVNNDYTYWEMYAIGGSHGATIISQGNRFIASPAFPYFKEVTHRMAPESEWHKWTWVSDGDLFMNGAKFVPSGNPNGARFYRDLELIRPSPASMVSELTWFAGFLNCVPNRPC